MQRRTGYAAMAAAKRQAEVPSQMHDRPAARRVPHHVPGAGGGAITDRQSRLAALSARRRPGGAVAACETQTDGGNASARASQCDGGDCASVASQSFWEASAASQTACQPEPLRPFFFLYARWR